ncbi:flavin reductase family protein [Streptomyces sp. NPDC093591]|uniref:flavin reductase family protein n=1 Tax=Streptomyces sp. NPDC093591 TaxID=3366044 RepID=UPI0038068A3C
MREHASLDGRTLRNAFGKFPTGVVAVCALDGEEPVGMAVSAFMPVSLEPPLLSVCIQQSSNTWPRLRRCGAIGISVLSREQREHAQRLSSKDGDRFAGIGMLALASGAVVLEDTHAWFECEIDASYDAGDHIIAVMRILDLCVEHEADDPMVFYGSRFRGIRHLGGQPHPAYADAPIPATKKRV